MDKKKYPEFKLDSFNLVNFLFRYWKLFLIAGVGAFIISAVVSLTIEPLFRSGVTLYPASNISESGSALFGTGSTTLNFGDEEATEKILQMLQSDVINDYLIEEYDLFSHYDIKPDAKYKYSLLGAQIDKKISFRKTQYMSVQINVLDADPVIASKMANDIAAFVDTTFNRLLRDAGKKQLLILEKQYNNQYTLVRSYEDSIKVSGKGTITGYRSGRGEDGISISPYSPELMRFSANHDLAIEDLGVIRQRYIEARMAADENLSYTLIVNEARPSEKKALPNRSMIAIVSTISALLLLMFVLIIIDGLVIPGKK